MAEHDWTLMSGNPGADIISWGHTVAPGIIAAPGHAMGFHSLEPVVAFAGLTLGGPEANGGLDTFNPITGRKGCVLKSSVRRVTPAPGYSPMIFACNSRNATSAQGYMLGISTSDPPHVVLAKGPLASGLVEGSANIIAVERIMPLDLLGWIYLELILTVETQGDIAIRAKSGAVSGGMPVIGYIFDSEAHPIIDDSIGLLTGSTPLAGNFYVGIGHYNAGPSGLCSAFRIIQAARQTAP